MISRRAALAALAAALAATACGPNQCPMDVAYVDTSKLPLPSGSCSVSGTSYTVPVALCEDCRYTSPNCQADVLSRPTSTANGEVQLATQWQVCQDNQGCNFSAGASCYQPSCTIAVPVPGTYTVSYITGTDSSGNFTTGSFDVTFGAGPSTCG
jgi:hypothetical protein